MDELARDFFARHTDVTLAALGSRANQESLELRPAGVPATFFAAEQHATLVERYRDANALAFPGDLTLPGWVLSDLYLSTARSIPSSPMRRMSPKSPVSQAR